MRGGWEGGRGVGGEDGVLAEGGEAGDALASGGGGVEGGYGRLGRVVVEGGRWEEDGPAVDSAEEALCDNVSWVCTRKTRMTHFHDAETNEASDIYSEILHIIFLHPFQHCGARLQP